MTDSSIQAGLTGTFINIKLTVHAIKPRHTLTGIHANKIMASSSVVTGAGLTLIYFMFTVDPLVKKDSISENRSVCKTGSNKESLCIDLNEL